MNDLEYSTDAKNILNEFYEVERILYVEGIDDVAFWGALFDKYCDKKIEIIDVDGIENLKPYIQQIETNEIHNAYVACDQDYNFFTGKTWHEKIICTFGHSIENSLVSKETICDVVRGLSKSNKRKIIQDSFDTWFTDFKQSTSDLIYCDIYNEMNKFGFSILGNNCDRFLVKNDDYIICNQKITRYISNFFEQEVITEIRDQFSQNSNHILPNFIRGHFLLSAAVKFVTVLCSSLADKKVNISKDAFFSNVFISFEKNLEIHPHNTYYQSKISNLT